MIVEKIVALDMDFFARIKVQAMILLIRRKQCVICFGKFSLKQY